MATPLFSEKQKTELAQHKMLHQHNLGQAKKFALCSLQAHQALLELYLVFVDVVEKIRSKKEMTEFLRRLSENADIEIQFRSEDLNTQKIELNDKLTEFMKKTKTNITRLRKSLDR